MEVALSEALPTVAEHVDIRARVGWGSIDQDTASTTIERATLTISLA